jgi:hypothetical protein
MGRGYFVPGANKVYCQDCGRPSKSFELRLRYDNLHVCSRCWNPKHTQEYPPRITPEMPPVFTAPSNDIILDECRLEGRIGLPGVGLPDCWMIEFDPYAHERPDEE